jgi:hypothetical protein
VLAELRLSGRIDEAERLLTGLDDQPAAPARSYSCISNGRPGASALLERLSDPATMTCLYLEPSHWGGT